LGSLQVIGVVGGLMAAVLWGLSTVAASRSTRLIGPQQALAWVMLTGFVVVIVVAPVVEGVPDDVTAAGVTWALIAGFSSVWGLSMMYRALRIGKVGVVAPIASTEGAIAAVVSVAFLGESLNVPVTVALCVVAAGVVVVTFHGRLADLHVLPCVYAFAAATAFGVALISSAKAGDAVGIFWTILIARIVGVLYTAVPLAVRKDLPWPGRVVLICVFTGLAEVTGFATYIYATGEGVAVPAVLGSQFAAVAALASFIAFGERITRVQFAGALVIMAGVAAVAAMRV
jgi:drug/metabolite transporter (DMT)-like permease